MLNALVGAGRAACGQTGGQTGGLQRVQSDIYYPQPPLSPGIAITRLRLKPEPKAEKRHNWKDKKVTPRAVK